MRAALVIGWMLVTAVASAQDAGAPDCASVSVGAPEAETCAELAFRAAQAAERAMDLRFAVSSDADVVSTILQPSERARFAARVYDEVVRWARPAWTVRAHVAQARIFDRLAGVVRIALVDERHPLRDVDPQMGPYECPAVVPYLRAVRTARLAAVQIPEATEALDRLRRYTTARIVACVADEQTRDASFARFVLQELVP